MSPCSTSSLPSAQSSQIIWKWSPQDGYVVVYVLVSTGKTSSVSTRLWSPWTPSHNFMLLSYIPLLTPNSFIFLNYLVLNYLTLSKRPLLESWTVLSILGSLCRYKGLNLKMHAGPCFQRIILGLKYKCSHDVVSHIHKHSRPFRNVWVTPVLDSRCLGFHDFPSTLN